MEPPFDRRKIPRYPSHVLQAVLSIPQLSDAPLAPDDIGPGGFKLSAHTKLKPGTKLDVGIRISNSPIGQFEASVIRSMGDKSNPGMWKISAKFVMADINRKRFSELLKKLGDESDFRVLIVESHPDLRQTIVGMMKSLGMKTIRNVPTGSKALEVLQKISFDLIISEWSLPQVSGMEILRSIRDSPLNRQTLFIMLSGKGELQADDISESADYDVDAHLFKPINQERLEKLVKGALKKKLESLKSVVHLNRAGAFTDVGAMEEAQSEMESAQKEPPKSTRFWVELGALYEETGNDEKGYECYGRAMEINENYAKAHEGMASILNKEGKTEEAFESLQKASNLNPRNRDRQFKLAKALMKKGDDDGARVIVHRALGAETEDSARNAAAAEFFLEAGRADLAEEEYAFALEADPGNVHYYNRMGIAFRRQNKYQEAIDNYRNAIKVDPANAVLYYNMGIALVEGKKTNEALAALRKSLVLQPDFPQAEIILKKLKLSLKQP